METALLVLASFVVGALPFSFWLAKLAAGIDLRTVGSGNPGATNVLRAAGAGPAVIALLLDIAKGAAPVLMAIELRANAVVIAMAGLAAILGHVWSPFLGLRGGKGVATAAGALAVLNPLATAIGMGVFLVMLAWRRYVSLSSMAAAATIVVLSAAGVGSAFIGRVGTLATMVVGVVVLARHGSNVRRLLAGSEPRLGDKVVHR